MVYFTDIRPTRHYLENHAQDVPWHKAVEIILTTKDPKKKEGKFVIEKENCYILFKIEDNVLYLINAKQSR